MKQTILMTGGGTLGPVTPLLAIAKRWQEVDPDVDVAWVGTAEGPEAEVVAAHGYAFHAMHVPKLSRHAWWTWPLVLPQLLMSCIRAYRLLDELRPEIVFTAGGYTSVPFVWMARLIGIPTWVHQLDVLPGLANRLMAPFATRVSVTWEESAAAFGAEKTLIVGGMVRPDILSGSREAFLREHKLDPERKTVLVFGGGTGAEQINDAMLVIGRELTTRFNVVHITGKGKMREAFHEMGPAYVAYEFFNTEMKHALSAADVVVARAGMGSMLELIALQKPSILIPILGSHQEANARVARERGVARVITALTPQVLQQEIVRLATNTEMVRDMKYAMEKALTMDADRKIVAKAREIVGVG